MKLSPEMTRLVLAASGEEPSARKRKPPCVRIKRAGQWLITLTLSCRVKSEANSRDHWTVKRRRAEIQSDALYFALAGSGLTSHQPPLPVVVTWRRIGWQEMDDDNLRSAFKALRDAIAKWLGCDDGDKTAVEWCYEDVMGEPGVVVTVQSRGVSDGVRVQVLSVRP